MTDTTKAKRRLTDIKFEKEGSHIALVHSSQGGAANGWHDAVVMKATDDVTDEFLEKATMVQVTLPFDDFLEKFFGMWSENADMLTEILGFSDEEDMTEADKSEMSWEEYKAECEKEKQDFINSVKIMKSLKDGELSISSLNAESYLSVLLTQSLYEQHMDDIEKATITSKEKKVQIEQELQKAKESLDAKDAEVAKAVADLQKAKEDLDAAMQELNVMKAAQVAAKDGARKQAIAAAVPADKVDDVFKSLNALDDVAFNTVLDVMKATAAAEEEVFKEKGITGGDADQVQEDKASAVLKAKYAPK